jgi:hypothetical protein
MAATPRERLVSGPEIEVSYGRVGRETMTLIAEEVLSRQQGAPEPEFREAVAGRTTLGAIAEEMAPGHRSPMSTLPYGDRVSNAPGAITPQRAELMSSTPEIRVGHAGVGRETMEAIRRELDSGADSDVVPVVAADELAISEMVTFVVRAKNLDQLSTEPSRRAFVEQHLMPRLPVASMDDVERVDVTPWTVRGSVIVRVWCRVAIGDA